jgi:membrane associated rhomboid family serine protease
MALSSRPYSNRYVPSSRFPVGTKWLLIVTTAISILFRLFGSLPTVSFLHLLILQPEAVLRHFAVWQLFTYMFVNADIWQLVWNMLALWMFGAELERTWGTPRFLRFYLGCGVIAALAATIASFFWGGAMYLMPLPLGAAEAVLGLLVGYAVMFPDNTLLFGFLIPLKSKYFVMIIAAVVILQSIFTIPVVMAHVGALAAGYLLLRGKRLYVRGNLLASDTYKDWKLRRAKRKFQVYLRKNDSSRDRTIH